MDRKKTIVAAVMINAALLTVLFIVAMTMEEANVSNVSFEKPLDRLEQPLFQEPIPIALEIPVATELKIQEQVVHQLPLPAPVEPVAIAPVPSPSQGTVVVVQKGDNLEKIAKRHNTTVSELLKYNQLPNTFLKVGQKLKIPSEQAIVAMPKAKPVLQSDTSEYYTMKVGDNPWSIAMKHHLKVDELLKLNGLNEEKARKLKPGDRLRIR